MSNVPRALIQRDSELAVMESRLDAVRDGAGRVIVVEGPAGIGKSTLLSAGARMAADAGMTVLRAWGDPLEQEAAWGIAWQLFSPVRAAEQWSEVAIGAAALAGRVLDPDGVETAHSADAQTAAICGLTWLAVNLADRRPTLLVLDDVQWADAPSLRWLVHLSRQVGEARLAVLCAVRSGEPPRDPMLVSRLLGGVGETPIRPGPLSPEAVGLLVREYFPDAVPVFIHACHAVTAGNPFLAHALLNALVAEQQAPTQEVATRLSSFGAEQVARSVDLQLARLPDGAAALAQAFSVLGRAVPLRHAARLANLAPADAALLADRLCEVGLVRQDGFTYTLVHPLVAAGLYGGLSPGQRALRHRHAAAVLCDERAEPEAIALHLLRCEPAGDRRVVELLRRAAARAACQGAPDSAAVMLRRALEEPPSTQALQADLRLELGLALAAQMDGGAPAEFRSALALSVTPEQRGRNALAGARALGMAGLFEEAIAVGRQGLLEADRIPVLLQARLEAEFSCVAQLWRPTVHEGLAVARRVCTDPVASPLLLIIEAGNYVCELRPSALSLTQIQSAWRSGVLAREPGSLLWTMSTFLALGCGDLTGVERLSGELMEYARSRGWLIALVHGAMTRARARLRQGRIREAEADARLAFDTKLGRSLPAALCWSTFPLVDALVELDELEEADRVLSAVAEQGEMPWQALGGALLQQSRGRLRAAQFRHAQAHADLCAAGERIAAFEFRHPLIADWRVADAAALMDLGEASRARWTGRDHLDLAHRVDVPEAVGAGLRAVALAVEPVEAAELLTEAVQVLSNSPAQLEHTRALVDLGAALRRANRRGQAREPLQLALDMAERGGMRRLAQRARHELHAAGVRPRRTAISGLAALTPAEYQIAQMTAGGATNLDIAQELYITRRTVETT